MPIRNFVIVAVLALGASLLRPVAARADTVLYDSVNFVQGQQSFVQAFTLTAPTTVNVSLENVPWLDTVKDLTCFVTSASGIVGQMMGAGSEQMRLDRGTYYVHWFGDADGTYKVGADKLKIDCLTAVPLPASLLLFLAGLGLLMGWQRRRGPEMAVA